MNFKKKKVEAALGNLFSGAKKPAEETKAAVKKPRPKPATPEPLNPSAETAVIQSPPEPPAMEKQVVMPQPAPEVAVPPVPPVPLPADKKVKPASEPTSHTPPATVSKTVASLVEETSVTTTIQPPPPSVSPSEKPSLPTTEPLEKEEIRQLVIFTLAGEAYGLPIEKVESIIQPQAITVVPNARPYVVGVTNLRGTVLPVIDLRRRFSLPDAVDTGDQRIVVVLYNDEKIGLRVDAVSQVLRLPAEAIEPPPALVTSAVHSGFITGVAKVEDQLVILLDLEKVLASESQG